MSVTADKILYRCTLCEDNPYTSNRPDNVMRHITKSKSGGHDGHSGEWSYIEEIDDEEQKEIIRETANAYYRGPETGIDATMQHFHERPYSEPPEHDDIDVVLPIEMVFEIIRNADVDVAYHIFEGLFTDHHNNYE